MNTLAFQKDALSVTALIPARSGSKSVPNKNVRPINGKPMLAYSIEHALASKYINRVILSTDSTEYATIGKSYGAEVPFLRPTEFASDTALDIDVFYHALSFLEREEGYHADIVVHLRPTYPIRRVEDIDAMIERLIDHPKADSIRSLSLARENPFKMWTMEKDSIIKPISTEIHECYNMPRQSLPTAYYQNACIDVVRGDVILRKKSMTGDCILGYLMQDNFDVDTEEDFDAAAQILEIRNGRRVFCVDIDGVLANSPDTHDYSKSSPNRAIIDRVNHLADLGNKIILFTARGDGTGMDWKELTIRQMRDWGVRFSEIRRGKPAADFYLDDHALTLSTFNYITQFI